MKNKPAFNKNDVAEICVIHAIKKTDTCMEAFRMSLDHYKVLMQCNDNNDAVETINIAFKTLAEKEFKKESA